jgi:hypothetical protein
MKNWAEFLKSLIPFEQADIPDALYIQKNNGVWLPIGFDVLPASRGGTGLHGIADGEMLYGSNGGFAKLEKPEHTAFLQFNEGNPVWAAMSAMSEHGYARIATGSYVGNEEVRTIKLPVKPKLLIIHRADNSDFYRENGEMFQDGIKHEYALDGVDASGSPSQYDAGITLEGSTLRTYYRVRGNSPAVNP